MTPTMAPIASRPPITPPTIAPIGAPDFSGSLPETTSVDVEDPVPMIVEREGRDVVLEVVRVEVVEVLDDSTAVS
jgi:hypothetical protein